MATQNSPSVPVDTLSGKPGRLSTKTSASPARGPVIHTLLSRYAAVSATTTNEPSGASATPLANCSPSASTVTSAARPRRSSRPVPECSSRSAFHASIPKRRDESLK